MSPSTTLGNSAPVWRIERFELVYYDPRYCRWQYFAEDPLGTSTGHIPGEGPHRRQIRRFLNTIHDTVDAVLRRHGSLPFATRQREAASDSTIVIEQPTFEGWERNWDHYLATLCDAADDEGLPAEILGDLARLRQELSAATSGGSCSVSRATALALLSLLPILPDWDTWGAFVNARGLQTHSTAAPRAFPPVRNGDSWFQLAVAEFTYGPAALNPSSEIVGKTVTLEACCLDLSRQSANLIDVPKDDFYAYCQRPRTSEELYVYRCYSHFVDDLIQKLSSSNGTPIAEDASRYFVISYPVIVSKRLHFFQIAVTTADVTPSVQQLAADWTALHREVWRPGCISHFEQDLARISLSAFQFAAAGTLERDVASVADPSVRHHVLAQHVPWVLELESVVIGDTRWSYVPHERHAMPLGHRWAAQRRVPDGTPSGHGSPLEVEVPRHGIVIVPKSHSRSFRREVLLRHGALQVVEQQVDYLQSMADAVVKAQEVAQLKRAKVRGVLRALVTALDPSTRQAVSEATTIASVESLLGLDSRALRDFHAVDSTFSSVSSAIRFAYRGNDNAALRGLHSMVAPSLMKQLSEYFETGPAKLVSHRGSLHYFSGSYDDLKDAYETYYTALAHKIAESLSKLDYHELSVTFLTFHLAIGSHISSIDAPAAMHDMALEARHRGFRHHLMTIDGWPCIAEGDSSGFRSFVINPNIVIGDHFFGSLAESRLPTLTRAVYTRRLLDDVYVGRWSPVDGYPVKLVEHYFLVPMPPFDPQRIADGSEIGEAWASRQAWAGTLLLWTPDGAWTIVGKQAYKADHASIVGLADIRRDVGMPDEYGLIVKCEGWRTLENAAMERRFKSPLVKRRDGGGQ